jgi:hypothetical protein
MNKRMLKVFLCHSSQDKAVVQDLYNKLINVGVKPWIDTMDILPGQDWDLEIKKAVKTSDVVLICLSKSSINKRGYVQKEIKYAIDIAHEMPEGAIFLIPIKLEECEVPDRLRNIQWVNYFEANAFYRLHSSLSKQEEELGIRKDNYPIFQPEYAQGIILDYKTIYNAVKTKKILPISQRSIIWDGKTNLKPILEYLDMDYGNLSYCVYGYMAEGSSFPGYPDWFAIGKLIFEMKKIISQINDNNTPCLLEVESLLNRIVSLKQEARDFLGGKKFDQEMYGLLAGIE